MHKLRLKDQAGIVFLLAGTGGWRESDVLEWAKRVKQNYSDPPSWVSELIRCEGGNAPPILGKCGIFETAEDYAALAEYCHRNRLGNDSSICSELYSMWQYYADEPKYQDLLRLLLEAHNKLYAKDPAGEKVYRRFLKKFRKLDGELE